MSLTPISGLSYPTGLTIGTGITRTGGLTDIGAGGAAAPVAYLGQVATAAATSTTRSTTASSQIYTRKGHIARQALTAFQLNYSNWWVDTSNNSDGLGQERNTGNAISVEAYVEYPVGVFTQVMFSTSATGNIPDGDDLLCDPITLAIPNGATFYTRTKAVGSGGNNYPYTTSGTVGNPLFYTGGGVEASYRGTSGFPTLNGTITDNNSGRQGYWPSAIVAMTTNDTFFLLSDSRGRGTSDVADSSFDLGNLARSVGTTHAYIMACTGGDRISSFIGSSSRRMALSNYCNVIIDGLGTNAFFQQGCRDSTIAAAYKKRLNRMFNGRVYAQTTAEPNTTSSDGFATASGQTVAGSNTGRIGYNTVVRTEPSSVKYVELANVIESNNLGNGTLTQDGGYWLATGVAGAYTSDGTHYKQAGNLLVPSAGVLVPAIIAAYLPINVPALSMTMSSTATPITYAACKFGNGVSGGFPYFGGAIPAYPPLTMEAWVKNAAPIAGHLFGFLGVNVRTSGASGVAQIVIGTGSSANGTVNVCDGVAHHVALTISTAGVVNVWVDGVLDATITNAAWQSTQWANEASVLAVRFRSLVEATPTANTPWTNGVVEELAVFNSEKYTGAFTPPTAPYVGNEVNLIALWHFNDSLNGIAGSAF